MAASLNINDILSQVKRLDKEDQLTLLQRMAYLLKRGDAEKTTSIRLTLLSGLGSEIWKSVDSIDKYLDEERQGNPRFYFKNDLSGHRTTNLFY